jgi:hypothetical protein
MTAPANEDLANVTLLPSRSTVTGALVPRVAEFSLHR